MEEKFGEKLRACRKAKRLRLREVAAAAEMSEGYISRLEHGKVNPGFAMVLRLSKALDVDIVDLIPTGEEVERHEEKISA